MANITNQDAERVVKRQYDLYLNGTFIGFTLEGATNVTIGKNNVNVDDSEQIAAVLKTFSRLGTITVDTTLLELDFERLNQFYMKGLLTQQATNKYSLGYQEIDQKDSANNFILRMHPTQLADSDYTGDVLFHQVAITSDITIPSSRDTKVEFPLQFTVFPDLDRDTDAAYGVFGDWTASDSDPSFIYLTTTKTAIAPYKHVPAISLDTGSNTDIQAIATYASTTTSTAALNEAAGITATDTSFDYDTASPDNAISDGDIIQIGTELIYVDSVSASSATAGTLTVVRGVGGSTAAAHLDNAVITVMDVDFPNVTQTDGSSFTSGTPAAATVGDTAFGSGDNRRGRIVHVAAGSSNVTAAIGATTSPNLAVTAN